MFNLSSRGRGLNRQDAKTPRKNRKGGVQVRDKGMEPIVPYLFFLGVLASWRFIN
jgi:hypothetical protein